MKPALALLLALALPACALARFSETPEGQPVYVLANPSCVFVCASDLGTAREEVTGFGTLSGGGVALTQGASAAGGGGLSLSEGGP